LIEIETERKDPIEDAFNHLRSLLKFQTSLKKSANILIDTQGSDKNKRYEKNMFAHLPQNTSTSKIRSTKTPSHQTFNRLSEASQKSQGKSKSFIKRSETPTSYSQMHSSRSHSREHKKSKTSTKIYSQLVSSKNAQKGLMLGNKSKSSKLENSPKAKKKNRKSSVSDLKLKKSKRKERDSSFQGMLGKRKVKN